jgi:hypothetical protein
VAAPQGVEDPISALFDLSDRAAAMAPVVRRLYRYTAAILVVWIAIMAILTLVGLAAAGWLSVLALIGLGAGVIALGLLRQTDRFFREFVQRHRWIHLVRDADPGAKIPEGRTPVERLGRYLVSTNPRIEAAVQAAPTALQYRASVKARGREVALDLVLTHPAGLWQRWTEGEESSFAVVARVCGAAVTLEDVKQLEADAVAAAPGLGARLARIILLRTEGGPLPEPVYEYAVGHPVLVPWGFSKSRATLEIITEAEGGRYDFVPHVLGVP